MRIRAVFPLTLGLALLLPGCLSHRHVEVRTGRRVVETLPATLERSQGLWTLDVSLPQGTWEVRFPGESGAPRVVSGGPRSHARLDIDDARVRQDRPLTLELSHADGSGPALVYTLHILFPGERVLMNPVVRCLLHPGLRIG